MTASVLKLAKLIARAAIREELQSGAANVTDQSNSMTSAQGETMPDEGDGAEGREPTESGKQGADSAR